MEDFTSIEEAAIAHLVIAILKLGPINVFKSELYRSICKYFILLTKNLGLLLELLSSKIMPITNILRNICADKTSSHL